jgi:MYXO-CTERM domain-containing protein
MTARTLVLTAVAVCAAASPAAAKGISEVKMCGAEGCRDVTDGATFAVMEGGPATSAPTAGRPWFDVRITVSHGEEYEDRWTVRWLPEAEVMRGPDGAWTKVSTAAQTELVAMSKGMEPRGVKPKAEDSGGPPALAIAAPAALILLGGGALARRRRHAH